MTVKDRQAISTEVYNLAASREPISDQVKAALHVIEDALDVYTPDKVSISFNGGKDCTVLLHLYAAALARRTPLCTKPIPAVYIPVPSPFIELEDFIQESAKAYNLDLLRCSSESDAPLPVESVTPGIETPDARKQRDDPASFFQPVGNARGGEGMRRALYLYKEKYPQIEAILVGTRRSDPHGATLTYRNKTDVGWPSFERINPIINWSYSDVWTFLRRLNVPYSSILRGDNRYTSLGSIYNTFPNPALRIQDDASSEMLPSSVTIIANEPNAMCMAETPAPCQLKPAAAESRFEDFTVIASDPESTCTAEPSMESATLGSFRVIASDPLTMCVAESKLVNGNGHAKPLSQSARYKPAYMLQDEGLERAGRVCGTALMGKSLTLLTSSNARWTATQEKTIARDYPFTDIHLETPDQFVVRMYLQFLWLPESIMPINLLVPSLHRVQDASPQSPDSPHPLHALLDPLLLSVRSVTSKYHTDLPQILAQDGGEGELEESMMWYTLGYEMSGVGEGGTRLNNEDAIMLEEKSRNIWLERLERREVQIQILLYLLKLSLPGPCSPLPRVKIPANDVVPSTKKKRQKERAKYIVPSTHERLESFMDKLSMWQLVINMTDLNKDKDKRDWMQAFCENVVERQFKSTLPDTCALLRRKLFPHSPFQPTTTLTRDRVPNLKWLAPIIHVLTVNLRDRPLPPLFPSPRANLTPIQSSAPPLSYPTPPHQMRDLVHVPCPSRLHRMRPQGAPCSTSGTSLKRALSREVSMSRGFKPRAQQSQASRPNTSGTKVAAKPKREDKKEDNRSQGVTLVAATPTKPKVRGNYRHASSQSQTRAFSPNLGVGPEDDHDVTGNDTDHEGMTQVRDEDEELWLPGSSPDVLLLGPRKRAASGSSSSRGLSDPDEGGIDTPVRKRLRI
ncbi:hypothetical protein JVT61DRAFT_8287 [Boletus reticuloceps]|uniref:FAD synthase n=1 Tax=Boletus reticuloceps TaxID=495285 RepID=A0A8I3AF96_9AGAM|nr:hypothetical protein JVT61DRAFT_8287 [Boletus reticuloceps]